MLYLEMTHVLVVDDDEVDRMLVKRTLKQTHPQITVIEAEDCRSALALIQQQPFDCAFIDYNLPDGNGVELVSEFRSLGIKFPLIALTGQGDEQVAVDLMKAGASDYIKKNNVKPDLFHHILHQCMRLYQAQLEADEIKKQREDLLEQREAFISYMTHDMQTPLVGANRMLELIQDDAFGAVSNSVKQKINIIVHSNKDLLTMVRDLVDVYSYDTNLEEISRIPIDIRDLAQDVIQELSPLVINRDLDLKLIIENQEINYKISIDRLAFKRVLVNLIGNSLKFTEIGHISLIITGSSENNPMIKISIQDTGVGISPEDLKQVFERFRKGNHKRSNSGLGLYLCRQIVEKHNGTINAESQLNQGTTFTIQLPV
jgi:two-component system sensor histidine kinase/response regulator